MEIVFYESLITFLHRTQIFTPKIVEPIGFISNILPSKIPVNEFSFVKVCCKKSDNNLYLFFSENDENAIKLIRKKDNYIFIDEYIKVFFMCIFIVIFSNSDFFQYFDVNYATDRMIMLRIEPDVTKFSSDFHKNFVKDFEEI